MTGLPAISWPAASSSDCVRMQLNIARRFHCEAWLPWRPHHDVKLHQTGSSSRPQPHSHSKTGLDRAVSTTASRGLKSPVRRPRPQDESGSPGRVDRDAIGTALWTTLSKFFYEDLHLRPAWAEHEAAGPRCLAMLGRGPTFLFG